MWCDVHVPTGRNALGRVTSDRGRPDEVDAAAAILARAFHDDALTVHLYPERARAVAPGAADVPGARPVRLPVRPGRSAHRVRGGRDVGASGCGGRDPRAVEGGRPRRPSRGGPAEPARCFLRSRWSGARARCSRAALVSAPARRRPRQSGRWSRVGASATRARQGGRGRSILLSGDVRRAHRSLLSPQRVRPRRGGGGAQFGHPLLVLPTRTADERPGTAEERRLPGSRASAPRLLGQEEAAVVVLSNALRARWWVD